MNAHIDPTLVLVAISGLVAAWCASVVAFALIKADGNRSTALRALTDAFGETLIFAGERLRRSGSEGVVQPRRSP